MSILTHRIQQLHAYHSLTLPKKEETKVQKESFKDILSTFDKIKISKHAKQRMAERDIKISIKQWNDIETKMKEAKKKGVTDSLVVMDHATLLVSTKNNTVVTALNHDEASSRIFTNINGTILID